MVSTMVPRASFFPVNGGGRDILPLGVDGGLLWLPGDWNLLEVNERDCEGVLFGLFLMVMDAG